MPQVYFHRQVVGITALVIGFAAVALLCIVMGVNRAWGPAIAVVAVIAVIAFFFSSLTISVDPSEVSWYFGPGLWRYRVARDTIDSVSIVRNSPLNGFGIRMRPGWRLYNVYGLDAVEMRLRSGGIIRLGTDDPKGLEAALKS
jgi:hypothetical protein